MDVQLVVLTVIFIVLASVVAKPIQYDIYDVKKYLNSYGYSTKSGLTDAVKMFQKVNGLTITGKINEETLTLIETPRCGQTDRNLIDQITPFTKTSSGLPRPAQYKLFATGNKWTKKNINWYVTKYTNQLSQDDQRRAFRKALKKWEEVSSLEFSERREEVDIEIKFVTRDHGDDSSFDGPSQGNRGTVLAHAFAPGRVALAGDAHFDDDEQWTADVDNENKEKKFLELIAAHEFGHALGLEHSYDSEALMSAYYVNSQREYNLAQDDINGIQFLYGPPNGWKGITTPKPTTPPPIPVCHNLFKAIVWGPDRRTYGVYNDKVIELEDEQFVVSFPRSLQDVFPNSPIGVDFATTFPDASTTYMFRGYSVWKYNRYTLDKNYPAKFDIRGFPEIPIGVFSVYEGREITIFIYGPTYFWRWDPTQTDGNRGYTYSNSLGYWTKDLASYDLVTTWNNGDIYLINADSHTKLQGRKEVRGYPKKGIPLWLQAGCRNGSSEQAVTNISLFLLVFVTSYLSI